MMLVFSPDDLASVTIWGEARGEEYKGQIAIGEVIRNRMAARFFSDGTVAGTVARPLQFSCWNSSDPNRLKMLQVDRMDPIFKGCAQAWVESGQSDFSGSALMYHNKGMVPQWASDFQMSCQIGNHIFYRKNS